MRYASGKIYKIINDVDDQIYVGSTCKPRLCQRMTAHRTAYHASLATNTPTDIMKIYHHMREIGMEHFRIELIENYACQTKEQLSAREGHWISQLHPSLNAKIAWPVTDQMPSVTAGISQQAATRARTTQKIMCPCGGRTTAGNRTAHERTHMHRFYLSCDGINAISMA